MEITVKEYITYKENDIIPLYQAVGWSNYYNKPQMLQKAYENSLYILGAYTDEQLIGIIRVVGDGHSIIYIQDLLVHPDYQRQGIGQLLFEKIMDQYQTVYQKVLITEDTEKTRCFYEKMGFSAIGEMKGNCFVHYTF